MFPWCMVAVALLFLALEPPMSSRFVLSNVDVFDGYELSRNQSVTIEDGVIKAVSAAQGQPTGMTLLPGLIDAHVHIAREESLEQAAALGVTTELDMWGDPKVLIPLKRAVESGDYPNAADFRTAGTGATVAHGHPTEFGTPMPVLGPKEDIQNFADARFKEGSDYLKIMYEHDLPTLTEAQVVGLVAAAHRRGKLVVAHEGVQAEGLTEMKAGVDGVEHIFADSPITSEFLALAKSTHMVFTPTLTVISAASGLPTGGELTRDQRFAPYLLRWNVDVMNATFPPKVTSRNHFEFAREAVRALHQAGLPILAGTDSPNPSTGFGVSLHAELLLLTQCGLTPIEALRAATSEPAKQFGLIDRGRIEIGRRADLLLVKGDPTKDIRATRDIMRVWKAGREIDRQAVMRKLRAE